MSSAQHECAQAYIRLTGGLARLGQVSMTTDEYCNKTKMSIPVRHMLRGKPSNGRRWLLVYNNFRDNTVTVALEEHKGVTEDDLDGTYHRNFVWKYEPIGGGQFRLTEDETFPGVGKITPFGAFEPPLPEAWADLVRLFETDAIRDMVCIA